LEQYRLLLGRQLQAERYGLTASVPVLLAILRLRPERIRSWDAAGTFPPGEECDPEVLSDIDRYFDLLDTSVPEAHRRDGRRFDLDHFAKRRRHAALVVLSVGDRDASAWRKALWVHTPEGWVLRRRVILASEQFFASVNSGPVDSLYTRFWRIIKDELRVEAPHSQPGCYAELVTVAVEAATVDGVPPAWSGQVRSGQLPTRGTAVQ
jgi:hypothetical protein